MKIIDERQDKERKTFKELEYGECFYLLGENVFYMKIDNYYVNAARLESGIPVCVSDDSIVTPINAICVIKGE